MSGVTGNNKIQSRADFREILKTAKSVISGFPGFVSVDPTGSYNSDKKKTTFGDMDLITHIDGNLYDNDKKKIKSALAKYFKVMPDSIIAPFQSEKYMGKKYYNSGEIITISLQVPNPSIQACQVDFMIAMDATETKFKKDFLDMPAAKQGIVLGLVKTTLIEQTPNAVFRRLGIKEDTKDLDKSVQEYEFNLSSTEIQLRKVTYVEPGSFKQAKREIVWKSRDWDKLQVILKDFDLGLSFDKLIAQAKKTLKKTRSANRMAGVFKSMISIKSGEVGKQKGNDKQKALDKVARLFGESFGKKTFTEYVNENLKEMSYVSPNKEGLSRKSNWDKFYRNNISKLKLISDKVTTKKYKIYKSPNVYFLVSEKNKYLGYIEFRNITDDSIQITETNSILKGGFYEIMFTTIIGSKDIKTIYSDNNLTVNAIKSYNKLIGGNSVKVEIEDIKGNVYDKIEDNGAIFKITNEGAELFVSRLNREYNTIDEVTGKKASWGQMYENANTGLDEYMYCIKENGNNSWNNIDGSKELFKNLNESVKTHGIFTGRFQPCTKAHSKIINDMAKENDSCTVFLVKGKKTSEDKEKNPFNEEVQKKMLELVAPKNVNIEIIQTAFFVDELNKMPNGTKFTAYAGSDRVKAYTSFQKYMEDDRTLEIKEIKRTDEDISATKVRDALKNNDEEEFKKLTDSKIHSMFNELKEILG